MIWLERQKKRISILNFLKDNKNDDRKYMYLPECPGKIYFETHDSSLITGFRKQMNNFLPDLKPKVNIKASYDVSVQQADLRDKDCIYITNLKGLKGFSSCIPVLRKKLKLNLPRLKP